MLQFVCECKRQTQFILTSAPIQVDQAGEGPCDCIRVRVDKSNHAMHVVWPIHETSFNWPMNAPVSRTKPVPQLSGIFSVKETQHFEITWHLVVAFEIFPHATNGFLSSCLDLRITRLDMQHNGLCFIHVELTAPYYRFAHTLRQATLHSRCRFR